jgi:galactan 5-O-arabinofuranosyltransferase
VAAAGEAVLAVTAAALASIGIQWLVARLPFPVQSYAATAMGTFGLVLLAVAVCWLVLRHRWTRASTALSWLLVSAVTTLPLAIMLFGTRFYLFGVSGDQLFRTQLLGRMAASPALVDGNYVGLPSYYPLAWFWVGGRLAALLDLPAWVAYKPYAIVTLAVASVLAFVLWSVLVRRRTAFVLATVTAVVGLRVAAYEPYSWLLDASMVPMTVIAWQGMRAVIRGRWRAGWPSLLTVGLYLGACGAVYTLMFGLFLAVLAAVGITTALEYWVDAQRGGEVALGRRMLLVLLGWVLIGVAAVPLVALAWGPYLLRVLGTPPGPNAAAHYLPEVGATLPFPTLEVSVMGAVCLAGLLAVVLPAVTDRLVLLPVGILVVACYAWYLTAFALVPLGLTLLAFRIEPVLVTALACAAVLGAPAAGRFITRVTRRSADQWRLAATLLAALAFLQLVQGAQASEDATVGVSVVGQARAEYDDTGRTAAGTSNPADAGAWNGELIDTIGRLTGRAPADLVVLTDHYPLLAFRPYHGFQVSTAAYANPLAGFDQRRDLITVWAASNSSSDLLGGLDRSPQVPPTVFVLRRVATGLAVQVSADAWPRDTPRVYDVVFPGRLFEDPRFARTDVGPFTVITRR